MDFSNDMFKTAPFNSKAPNDKPSHANLVMACRWGWTSTPDSGGASAETPRVLVASASQPASSAFNNTRSKRFAPCQGRLYHQLLCSHRIRTDLVEDCGPNCLEPFGSAASLAFICHECIDAEATKIWEARKANHMASYPPMVLMTKDQYDQYYLEHRRLEAEYARDRRAYALDLEAKTRPSNACSAWEASEEEAEFATELDTLSLSLMASNDSTAHQSPFVPQTRTRVSLPTDASERLHWNLGNLALDRGSCGAEYSAQTSSNVSTPQAPQDELWGKPRG
ncbi:hypothetical protein ACEQ8H_007863 [Pleosporales sp. CAS-2024a]